MRTSALRRAVGAWVVLSISALIFGSGIVGNTFATFNAETTNANSSFAGGWLGAASAGTATAGGYDMTLAWTAPSVGPVAGQSLYGVDNGTNSNCTAAAYSLISSSPGATGHTYSDLSRGASATDGHWYCYEIVTTSTSAPNWTTPYAFPAAQLGLVANGVSIANAGTAKSIGTNDTITITFNQPQSTITSTASGLHVCSWTSTNAIVIGDTHGGTCHAANDTYSIGTLTLSGGDTIAANTAFSSSSSIVSGSTIVVKIGGGTSAINGTATPIWTFTPVAGVVSTQTSHQATICTSGATCQPTDSTTSF